MAHQRYPAGSPRVVHRGKGLNSCTLPLKHSMDASPALFSMVFGNVPRIMPCIMYKVIFKPSSLKAGLKAAKALFVSSAAEPVGIECHHMRAPGTLLRRAASLSHCSLHKKKSSTEDMWAPMPLYTCTGQQYKSILPNSRNSLRELSTGSSSTATASPSSC